MQYLTREEIEKLAELGQKMGPGHWDQALMNARWDYHEKAIQIIKSLGIPDPKEVLEMGTMGASLVKGSDTLDYDKNWNFPGLKPTYIHDARRLPWPIETGKYEIFVALRVFMHLTPVQEECFHQAKRVANRIILVVPSHYNFEMHPNSRGVTYADVLAWNNDAPPTSHYETQFGDLYFWDKDTLGRGGALRPKSIVRLRTVVRAAKEAARFGMRVANRVLSPLELEIRRKNSAQAGITNNSTFGVDASKAFDDQNLTWVVEFAGASGTGKSLLCRECLRTKDTTDLWQNTTAIASPELRDGHNFPSGVNAVVYENLLGRKIADLESSEYPPFALYKELNRLAAVVMNDEAALHTEGGLCNFIASGICHNFSEELVALEKEDPEGFSRFMTGRIVIFCKAPTDVVVARIRHREQCGYLMHLHHDKDDSELRLMTQIAQDRHARLKRAMETHGLPFLVADCSGPAHIPMGAVKNATRSILATARHKQDRIH